jgi:hypothetical protein
MFKIIIDWSSRIVPAGSLPIRDPQQASRVQLWSFNNGMKSFQHIINALPGSHLAVFNDTYYESQELSQRDKKGGVF